MNTKIEYNKLGLDKKEIHFKKSKYLDSDVTLSLYCLTRQIFQHIYSRLINGMRKGNSIVQKTCREWFCMLEVWRLKSDKFMLPDKYIRKRVFNIQTLQKSRTFKETRVHQRKRIQDDWEFIKILTNDKKEDIPIKERFKKTLLNAPNYSLPLKGEDYIYLKEKWLEELLKVIDKYGESSFMEKSDKEWNVIKDRNLLAKIEEFKKENPYAYEVLFLESESVYLWMMHVQMRSFYHLIRKELSREEKRLFILSWFRYYPVFSGKMKNIFLGRIPALDPIIGSFFTIDEEIKGLIFSVIINKKNSNMKKELIRRWRNYLEFYPYWLNIIRMDERRAKKEYRREKDSYTLSFNDVVGYSKDGREIKIEDKVNKEIESKFTKPIEFKEEIESWLDKYCTNSQKKAIKLKFFEGKTEKEIAEIEGVTQPAINKRISQGIRVVREGLKLNKQ